jgi:hypothetical protein
MSFSINTGFEVRDRFVDIGGIVDHHCLNILFITVKMKTIKNSQIFQNHIFMRN